MRVKFTRLKFNKVNRKVIEEWKKTTKMVNQKIESVENVADNVLDLNPHGVEYIEIENTEVPDYEFEGTYRYNLEDGVWRYKPPNVNHWGGNPIPEDKIPNAIKKVKDEKNKKNENNKPIDKQHKARFD